MGTKGTAPAAGRCGARPEGQSGGGLPAPVCRRVRLSRRLADVKVSSAGGAEVVLTALPATRLERPKDLSLSRIIAIFELSITRKY